MLKTNPLLLVFLFFLLMHCACERKPDTDILICKHKFKQARDLAYSGYTRQSALDSSMALINESIQCDSIRKAVVDFKITLFIQMKKFKDGMKFIDSLQESDFTFRYKKNMTYKGFQGLDYTLKNDTINRNLIYKELIGDMEQYIEHQSMSKSEFEEIYIELFEIKSKFSDSKQINKEVEALKARYPDRKDFFDFFKE